MEQNRDNAGSGKRPNLKPVNHDHPYYGPDAFALRSSPPEPRPGLWAKIRGFFGRR